jgi:hypothetical protein
MEIARLRLHRSNVKNGTAADVSANVVILMQADGVIKCIYEREGQERAICDLSRSMASVCHASTKYPQRSGRCTLAWR